MGTQVAAAAVLMAPYAIVAIHWLGVDWFPLQDQAVAALRVGDIATTDTPLLGAFSRYGWSHPGPLWFWALAPWRWVLGDAGMVSGSVLMVGGILVSTSLMLWRRLGGVIAAVWTACSALVIAGVGAFGVMTPWNPNLAWPLYWALLAVLALVVLEASPRDLAIAVFLTAALVQLHIGYASVAVIPTATACILASGRLLERWRSGSGGRGVVPWLVATFVIWLPPLTEQLAHGRDGNLYLTARWFLSGQSGAIGGRTGLSDGLAYLGESLNVPPIGLGNSETLEPFTGWIVAGNPARIAVLLALVLSTWLATRYRPAPLRGLVWLSAATAATGVVAASMVVGSRWPYLFMWRFPLACFVLATCVALLVSTWVTDRSMWVHRGARWYLGVAVAASVVVTAATLARWSPETIRTLEPDGRALIEQALATDTADGVVVREFGPLLEGLGDGLVYAAEKEGRNFGVDPYLGYKFGRHRVLENPAAVWLVTEASPATSIALSIERARAVSISTPLDPAEDTQLTDLHVELAAALGGVGRDDLIDALGSPFAIGLLEEAGIELDPTDAMLLERLNSEVDRSGVPRMAVVSIDHVDVSGYGKALAHQPR